MPASLTARTGFPRRDAGSRQVFGVPLWQLTAVEALLAGVAVSLAAPNRALAAVAAVAAVAGSAAVLGRRSRRPLLAGVTTGAGYLARQRSARPAPPDADPRLAPLLEVLPRLEVGEIDLRHGQRLAVCFDGTGWTAMVALGDEGVLAGSSAPPRLPLAALADVLRVDDVPLAGVQLLLHSVPVPYSWRPDESPTTSSYHQLTGRLVPVVRQTLVVLRIDAVGGRSAIESRGGGSTGAARALKRSTTRLLELLAQAGVPARPVTQAAWPAAVAELAGTGPAPGGPDLASPAGAAQSTAGACRTRETRQALWVDDLAQVTWWVHAWPNDVAPLQALVDLAGRVPTSTTQVSFSLHPAGPGAPAGSVRCRGLLRIGDRSAEVVEAAAAALLAQTAGTQLGLQRLDGEHGPGYLATLPFGGGDR